MLSDTDKRNLLNNLSDAIKECQLRFGGKRELATDIDGRVIFLCTKLELIFIHGLKKQFKSTLKNTNLVKSITQFLDDTKFPIPQQIKQNIESISNDETTFWPVIKQIMNKLDIERFERLVNITNDTGRHRAWIRSCLNEHCIEKYTIAILNNQDLIRDFYEDTSFLMDKNYTSTLPMLLSGLQSVLFAINIDNPNLNILTKLASPTSMVNVRPVGDDVNRNQSVPNVNVNKKKVRKRGVILDDESESNENEEFKLELGNVVEEEPSPKEFKILHNPINYVKKIEVVEEVKKEDEDDEEKLSDDADSSTSEKNLDTFSSNVNLIPINTSFTNNHLLDNISVNSNHSGSCGSPLEPFRFGSYDPSNRKNPTTQTPLSQSLASNTITSSQTENLSLTELRQVVLTMIQRKDTFEELNKNLKLKLNEELNKNQTLTEQFKNIDKNAEGLKNQYESRIQSLEHENRLLKDQLKKYVSAVQLIHKPESNIPERNETLLRDYSHEAEQYEQKLIQVAEMHGELMEFNERLQKILNFKNLQIKNLMNELTELRGPLPDELRCDDTTSVEFDVESLNNLNLTLVNVWIPSAFLRSDKSGSHHVYQIYLRVKDDEWNIYRRFSHFYSIHSKLKEKYPQIGSIPFPKKKTIGNKDNKFVELRRKQLQVYLRKLINLVSQIDKDLNMKPCRETLIRAIPFFSDQHFIQPSQEQPIETVNSLGRVPRSNSNLFLSNSLTNGSPSRRTNLVNNQNELLYTGL